METESDLGRSLEFSYVPAKSRTIIEFGAILVGVGLLLGAWAFLTDAGLPPNLRLGLFSLAIGLVIVLGIPIIAVLYWSDPHWLKLWNDRIELGFANRKVSFGSDMVYALEWLSDSDTPSDESPGGMDRPSAMGNYHAVIVTLVTGEEYLIDAPSPQIRQALNRFFEAVRVEARVSILSRQANTANRTPEDAMTLTRVAEYKRLKMRKAFRVILMVMAGTVGLVLSFTMVYAASFWIAGVILLVLVLAVLTATYLMNSRHTWGPNALSDGGVGPSTRK